jgi:transcriptional regulator with XRE-family HTH domain
VGVRAQQIQKYENGRDRISSSRLFLLAIALRVPVSFFFAGLSIGAGRLTSKSRSFR